MSVNYPKVLDNSTAPVTEKTRDDQVPNSDGGYVYGVDCWTRLERFLILGTEGGSFYASPRKAATKEIAEGVRAALAEDPVRVIRRVVDVSNSGKAHKNDHALYVLALAASSEDDKTRSYALSMMRSVARTGTHLFTFIEYVTSMRGWGRGLRNAVIDWYETKAPEAMAYQITKYAQRNGWSHRDLMRLTHPVFNNFPHRALAAYAVRGTMPERPRDELWYLYLDGVNRIKTETDPKAAARLIADRGLPREVVPSELLRSRDVWAALLPGMGMTALIRNLVTMTRVGLLSPGSDATRLVTSALRDRENLVKGRIHPISVLSALRVYANSGAGGRAAEREGFVPVAPVSAIVTALDEAFYLSFEGIEPTGKSTLLALDVSASMTWDTISGVPGLTPREASAALAMVTARVEPHYEIVGFSYNYWARDSSLTELGIYANDSLETVIKKIESTPAGATDCSLPMRWAMERGHRFDSIAVYTDSETNTGRHPAEALKAYRKLVPGARLAVVGMVSNGFSIADPLDPGMMDVVGFSTDTPAVMADFFRGEL